MALTKAEIRDRVASDYLGILRLGQSLQAQDATRIEQGYDEVYAYLKDKGLASWSSTATVPVEVTPYLTAMIAKNCYNAYALNKERVNRILLDFVSAESNITELVSSENVSDEPPTDF